MSTIIYQPGQLVRHKANKAGLFRVESFNCFDGKILVVCKSMNPKGYSRTLSYRFNQENIKPIF